MRRFLFGDVDGGWIAAAITGGLALAGLIGGGIAYLLGWADRRHKTGMDEYREIVARQDAHIAELQKNQNECREREARQSRVIVYLHTTLRGHETVMMASGMKFEPMMDLADMLGDLNANEFEARTAAQNTALLHEEAKRVSNDSKGPADKS